MSGDADSNHRSPLSSSSSNPSGTQALSVTIEAEPAIEAGEQPAEAQDAAEAGDIAAVTAQATTTDDIETPLVVGPEEPVIPGGDGPDEMPSDLPADDDRPLEGEPEDPIVPFEEEEPDDRVQSDPVAEVVATTEAAAEPVETAIELAVEPAVETAMEMAADAEMAAESAVEAVVSAGEEFYQDNTPEAVGETEPLPEPEPAIARLVPVPQEPDPQLTQKLRAAVRETIADIEAKDRVFNAFGEASAQVKTALDEAGQDATRITFKLMEFAQANIRNNLEFARDYVALRSVPDMFELQTAYFKRQMALMNMQAEEFRKLTTEITSKTAAKPFKTSLKVVSGR